MRLKIHSLLLGFCFLLLYQFDKIIDYSFALCRYDAFRVKLNSLHSTKKQPPP